MKKILLAVAFGVFAVSAQAAVATDGFTVGAQASRYEYDEPSVMREKGGLYGLNVGYTRHIGAADRVVVTGELSYAAGTADYDGTGTMNTKVRNLEARALLGYDITVGSVTITPYTGLGFRVLYNDLRGISSSGAAGYRRTNTLAYVPIGANIGFTAGKLPFVVNAEFDPVLHGNQRSNLSDTGLGLPDVSNGQKHGYAVRLGAMVRVSKVSFGPYFRYFSMKDSEMNAIGYEPKNHTTEAGVQVKYHF